MEEPKEDNRIEKKRRISTPIDVEMRREKVLQLMEGGLTARRAIAKALKCSPSTIQNDIRALRKEIRNDNVIAFMDQIALEAGRLDYALTAIFPKVAAGDLDAINVMLAIQKRKASLFGWDGFVRDRMDMKDGAGIYHKPAPNPSDELADAAISNMSPDLRAAFNEIVNMPIDELNAYIANLKFLDDGTTIIDANPE